MIHWLQKIITILETETADLRELARIAGGNPKTFYRGINLEDLDVKDQNLEGMEFSTHLTGDEIRSTQLDFDIFSQANASSAKQLAHEIRGTKRQEERSALLLAHFLKNRSRGTQIIDSYAYDKATPTNSVLDVLRGVLRDEASGKKRSNLQIARKVSGCFRRAEDKTNDTYSLISLRSIYMSIPKFERGSDPRASTNYLKNNSKRLSISLKSQLVDENVFH